MFNKNINITSKQPSCIDFTLLTKTNLPFPLKKGTYPRMPWSTLKVKFRNSTSIVLSTDNTKQQRNHNTTASVENGTGVARFVENGSRCCRQKASKAPHHERCVVIMMHLNRAETEAMRCVNGGCYYVDNSSFDWSLGILGLWYK